MKRATIALLVGVGLGAATTLYFKVPGRSGAGRQSADRVPPTSAPRESSSPATLDADAVDALALRPFGTAERAALYAAASRADVRGLETLLIPARELTDQAARAFALDVLFARYAELDPDQAVAAAEETGLPAAQLAPLYRAWLHAAPAAALAALASLDGTKAQRIVVGLVPLVADDAALIDRILSAVPAAAAGPAMAESLARLAEGSPADALARARTIADPNARMAAVYRVLSSWAQRDPRAVVDYLASLDPPSRREVSGVWMQIASSAPDLALAHVDAIAAEQRPAVEQVALQALAQHDPLAAFARLAQMPRGFERQQLVQSIGQSYAARDADAALAWARSLQPPEPGALAGVAVGMAAKDMGRALDVAAGIGSAMEQTSAMQTIVSQATFRDPAASGELLDRVLALSNNMQRQMLTMSILSGWASREPAQAADWLLANAARTPADSFVQVASQYARADPTSAAAYASRMPSEVRGAWLRGVASGYAAQDPRAALAWVEQFRGSADYDDTAIAVLQGAAQVDPAAAAHVLDSIGRDDYRRGGVSTVAMSWSNRDPAAAASWAAGLADQGSRTMAMQAVAQAWSNQDPSAAQAWLLSQPAGPARDGALFPLISNQARFATPDPALLDALSTDQARVAGVQNAALAMARRDSDGTRAFVEANVADPAQRQRILSFVTQVGAARPGSGFFGTMPGPAFVAPMGFSSSPVDGLRSSGSAVVINASGGAVEYSARPAAVPMSPAGAPPVPRPRTSGKQ